MLHCYQNYNPRFHRYGTDDPGETGEKVTFQDIRTDRSQDSDSDMPELIRGMENLGVSEGV